MSEEKEKELEQKIESLTKQVTELEEAFGILCGYLGKMVEKIAKEHNDIVNAHNDLTKAFKSYVDHDMEDKKLDLYMRSEGFYDGY